MLQLPNFVLHRLHPTMGQEVDRVSYVVQGPSVPQHPQILKTGFTVEKVSVYELGERVSTFAES